ncbi:hypothetical protein NESM_000214400 [Novymonas esmeraldas]|uniref:Uncharacterized protein n=1 Tax=Novymonas esmeraldas TaxID=1808958 RepID=A0AAW0F892_9TRYP
MTTSPPPPPPPPPRTPTRTKPVQLVVRKQGAYEHGRWSTRILTIDIDAGTASVSRKNDPAASSDRCLHVQHVQMWPRYNASGIESRYDSLKAKMTLRITGAETSFADAAAAAALLRESPSRSSASVTRQSTLYATTDTPSVDSSESLTPSDSCSRRSGRSFASSSPSTPAPSAVTKTWFINFTSMDSYELAVMLLLRLKNTDGSRRRVFVDNVVADLATVKAAWAAEVDGADTIVPKSVSRTPLITCTQSARLSV